MQRQNRRSRQPSRSREHRAILQLVRDNRDLLEEVRQLRAAVSMYRAVVQQLQGGDKTLGSSVVCQAIQ
jgi:hypothetical protein